MKWITNCDANEPHTIQKELSLDWKNRIIVEGFPKETERYTVIELVRMGVVGLYDQNEDYQ